MEIPKPNTGNKLPTDRINDVENLSFMQLYNLTKIHCLAQPNDILNECIEKIERLKNELTDFLHERKMNPVTKNGLNRAIYNFSSSDEVNALYISSVVDNLYILDTEAKYLDYHVELDKYFLYWDSDTNEKFHIYMSYNGDDEGYGYYSFIFDNTLYLEDLEKDDFIKKSNKLMKKLKDLSYVSNRMGLPKWESLADILSLLI